MIRTVALMRHAARIMAIVGVFVLPAMMKLMIFQASA